MKKYWFLIILIALMLSACSMSLPGTPIASTETPTAQSTQLPTRDRNADQRPDILGTWVIDETKPLEGTYYAINAQGGAYYLPFSFSIGEPGGRVEFAENVMIYDSVAYNYQWVDNGRIKLEVSVGFTGTTWLVYMGKLDDGKLSLLNGKDGDVIVALSRSSTTQASITTPAKEKPTTGAAADEFQFGEIVSLDYSPTDWKHQGDALIHQSLLSCAVVAQSGTDALSGQSSGTTIGGFTWLVMGDAYALTVGNDQILGSVVADYGTEKAKCREAIEALLETVHATSVYAQKGECRYAPKQRLKVGNTTIASAGSYLRTSPRWADSTRIRQVKPAEKLTIEIVGGPVCAIYDQGEYSYWQVELSSGEKGWLAEGDTKEYYLVLK